jgi:hypothetical protein
MAIKLSLSLDCGCERIKPRPPLLCVKIFSLAMHEGINKMPAFVVCALIFIVVGAGTIGEKDK